MRVLALHLHATAAMQGALGLKYGRPFGLSSPAAAVSPTRMTVGFQQIDQHDGSLAEAELSVQRLCMRSNTFRSRDAALACRMLRSKHLKS